MEEEKPCIDRWGHKWGNAIPVFDSNPIRYAFICKKCSHTKTEELSKKPDKIKTYRPRGLSVEDHIKWIKKGYTKIGETKI